MRSTVEGFLRLHQNPSTALRAVPLPRKPGGGIGKDPLHLTPLIVYAAPSQRARGDRQC
jgi:hypothetical protein